MRVALSGVQGVGKTTLLNELKKLDNPNLVFYDEIVRSMLKEIKINEEGDDNTQRIIMDKHIDIIKQTDDDKINILDRCLLDSVAYGLSGYWCDKVSKNMLGEMMGNFAKYISSYDIIFYIAPEFDPVDDGVRSTNIAYRNNVDHYFKRLLELQRYLGTFLDQHPRQYLLKGSVEERMNTIKYELGL